MADRMRALDGIVTLVINRTDSRCGACNRNADPHELAHTMANMRGEGCGAVYTHVSSHYLDTESTCRRLRPDLTWLDFAPTEGGEPE